MEYRRVLKYLYSLDSSKIKLGLKNIKSLLKKLGNPEKNLKCIHVAGTNGKGSVCAMIYSVLRHQGYNVGIYTSPHLKKFNERIEVNDTLISDKEIAEYYSKIKKKFPKKKFFGSFFEITTAMAFLYFREKNIDFAVIEVGLGGRLDATNAIVPLVSAITNIGYEHTHILGNTLEEIASEKAGVIKRRVPAVTGATGAALRTIRKIASKRKSPLVIIKKDAIKKINFKYLNGEFQYKNSLIALETINILKRDYKIKISSKNIINGLRNAEWPARMQFIDTNVLVDCAHNPSGIKVLVEELKILKKEKNFEEIFFVFGALKDKNYIEMIREIDKLTPVMIFTKPNVGRALSLMQLRKTIKVINKIRNNKKYYFINNPKNALKYARSIAGKHDLVVVAGSIYLVGELI